MVVWCAMCDVGHYNKRVNTTKIATHSLLLLLFFYSFVSFNESMIEYEHTIFRAQYRFCHVHEPKKKI